MKTSIIKKLVLVPALLTVLAACSDFLDLKNPNDVVEDIFWTSEENIQSAMATVYSPIRGQMYGYYGAFTGYQNMNVRADDTWGIVDDDPETWRITIFLNTPNTDRNDYGSLMKCVNRANVLILKSADVVMDEGKKKELLAEAKFLRGFAYFLIVTNYGEAPLHLSPVSENPSSSMAPSVSEAELWAQVEADFREAKEYLPVTRPKEEVGRVTKGAAIACLGKAYIFQEKYAEGKTELDLLMKSPYTYDLVENPDDNFTEFTEMNKESIFEIVYNGGFGSGSWGAEESTSTQGMVLPNFFGPAGTGAWFKVMPTASIVEAFVKEERPDGSDTKFDKRMYTSFYFKHSDFGDVKPDEGWYGDMSFDAMWKECESKRLRGEPDFPVINGTKGRFLTKKYTNFYKNEPDANSMYNQKNQNNNLRVMRFAEILLLHAEACIKTNDLSDAAADLTRIRNRAGLAQKTWNGADELWEEMVHQKYLELFFEGHRFFDLKRWYGYEGMKAIYEKNKKQGVESFREKHLYFPLPQSEINTNSAAKQHPLWR